MKVSPKIICVIIIFLVIFHTKSNGQKNALPHSGTSWVGKLLRPVSCVKVHLPYDTIDLQRFRDSCAYYLNTDRNFEKHSHFTQIITQHLINLRLYNVAYVELRKQVAQSPVTEDSTNQLETTVKQAADLVLKNAPSDSIVGKINLLQGYIQQKQGRCYEANQTNWMGLSRLPISKYLTSWLTTSDNIAQNYITIGDYRMALNYSDKTADLLHKYYAETPDSSRVKTTHTKHLRNRGWAYLELGNTEEALKIFFAALDGADPSYQSDIYAFIARCYLVERKTDEAEYYANLSLRLELTLHPEEYPVDVKHILARCALQKGQLDRAKTLFLEELPFAKKIYSTFHPDCQKIYAYLVKIYTLQQRPDLAIEACQKTLRFYDETINDVENPASRKLKADYWLVELLYQKSRLLEGEFRKNGQREMLLAALNSVELAIDLQEQLFETFRDVSIKRQSVVDKRNLYQCGIEQALLLGNTAAAYLLTQRAKAAFLREKIAQIPNANHLPDSTLTEWQSLRNFLLLPDTSRTDRSLVVNAQIRLHFLEEQIRQFSPNFNQLIHAPMIMPVDSIMAQLPDNTTILEYFTGDTQIIIFALSKHGQQVFTVPADSILFQQIDQLRHHVVMNWDDHIQKSYIQNARYCYKALLEKPLATLRTERLWIIPDGVLHFIPFDALLTEDPVSGQLPWVLRQYTTGYAFSVMQFFPKNTVSNNQYMGWALQYSPETQALAMRGGQINGSNYGYLPKAYEEIVTSASLMSGRVFINEKANKASFLEQAPKAGIIHLVMHAVADSRQEGYLVFAPAVSKDSFEYETLPLSEIYRLNLKPQLAILSACSTADGVLMPGEGIESLGWGFQMAGARSVLMNQWSAEDNTSAAVVPAFLRYLKQGKGKDEALRQAKLDILNDPSFAALQAPVFWSGFMVSGSMETIEGDNTTGKNRFIAALCVFVFLVLLIRRFNRHKFFIQ